MRKRIRSINVSFLQHERAARAPTSYGAPTHPQCQYVTAYRGQRHRPCGCSGLAASALAYQSSAQGGAPARRRRRRTPRPAPGRQTRGAPRSGACARGSPACSAPAGATPRARPARSRAARAAPDALHLQNRRLLCCPALCCCDRKQGRITPWTPSWSPNTRLPCIQGRRSADAVPVKCGTQLCIRATSTSGCDMPEAALRAWQQHTAFDHIPCSTPAHHRRPKAHARPPHPPPCCLLGRQRRMLPSRAPAPAAPACPGSPGPPRSAGSPPPPPAKAWRPCIC